MNEEDRKTPQADGVSPKELAETAGRILVRVGQVHAIADEAREAAQRARNNSKDTCEKTAALSEQVLAWGAGNLFVPILVSIVMLTLQSCTLENAQKARFTIMKMSDDQEHELLGLRKELHDTYVQLEGARVRLELLAKLHPEFPEITPMPVPAKDSDPIRLSSKERSITKMDLVSLRKVDTRQVIIGNAANCEYYLLSNQGYYLQVSLDQYKTVKDDSVIRGRWRPLDEHQVLMAYVEHRQGKSSD